MIRIELYKKALNFLRKLDQKDSNRIAKKIEEIRVNPERYIFSLVNKSEYKLRVGNYRVFVNYEKEENKLIIYSNLDIEKMLIKKENE